MPVKCDIAGLEPEIIKYKSMTQNLVKDRTFSVFIASIDRVFKSTGNLFIISVIKRKYAGQVKSHLQCEHLYQC